MTAKEIYQKGLDKMRSYDVTTILPSLRKANEGSVNDVLNTNGCAYYQWTPGVIELLNPKQVVELGGAMGVWSILALQNLPKSSNLYSITLPEHGLEFSFMDSNPSNFYPIVGDDADITLFPCDLHKTDLWFFDSEHTPEQLRKEFVLYSPFFKKGTVILVDDIHSFDLDPVWDELCNKYDHFDATAPLHYSGYGILTV